MPLHVSSTMCSSPGGQNCIIQHLVSSHTVGGRPVHLRERDYTEMHGQQNIKKRSSMFSILSKI